MRCTILGYMYTPLLYVLHRLSFVVYIQVVDDNALQQALVTLLLDKRTKRFRSLVEVCVHDTLATQTPSSPHTDT